MGDTSTERPVLTHTLPEREQEVGAVLVLEQQVNLVDEDKGVLALRAVRRDAVEDAVEHDEHTDGQKLLAEIKDVVADETTVHVDVRLLGEGIKRAVREQLDGERDVLRFGFLLLEQLRAELLERRDRAGVAALLVVAVHALGAAVDERLFLCAEASGADELFAERQDEFGFQDHGVLPVAVFLVHIHSIDMVLTRCGDVDDLSAERLNKRRILTLRVDDDNVRVPVQHEVGNLALAGKRLTGAGYAEDERVAVEQAATVGDDHIVADRVLPVVDAALVSDLLYLEGHEDREAFGCQRSQHVDLSAPDGQHRIQPIHLLKLQNGKLTEMPSCR